MVVLFEVSGGQESHGALGRASLGVHWEMRKIMWGCELAAGLSYLYGRTKQHNWVIRGEDRINHDHQPPRFIILVWESVALTPIA